MSRKTHWDTNLVKQSPQRGRKYPCTELSGVYNINPYPDYAFREGRDSVNFDNVTCKRCLDWADKERLKLKQLFPVEDIKTLRIGDKIVVSGQLIVTEDTAHQYNSICKTRGVYPSKMRKRAWFVGIAYKAVKWEVSRDYDAGVDTTVKKQQLCARVRYSIGGKEAFAFPEQLFRVVD